MSTTIDNRVVEMQFDNKQFERNAQTSLGTLAKLKDSLKFTGASKGLENVNTAVKNCNFSPLHTAVETVGLKFNAMYTIADQALRNITNSAVNAGKRIASALTIEPVKMGFSEYETQIGAVQTILANTQSKGSTLDDVNSALDELNAYADKTIYNFTEMTRNIGTFTAAGVGLDKSVTSIKGIANLAAVSGSTSQQASTAMYQLSQALAAGKVQLMDWNSVVNAGMGGEVFQTALKRTAKQMGHNVDEMIKKYGSFRESLTQGEWLTADVLTETLTQLSGAYTKADLIAKGYSETQAEEIVKLAETAEGAATDVKTFTQLIDTTKESLQSGWTQTWETIIGDFEEAKELWSGISEVLGGLIGKSAESRNKLISGAFNSKWDQIVEKVEAAGVKTEDFENKVKEAAKAHGLDIDKIIEDHGSLEKAFQENAISADILKESLKGLTTAGKKLGDFNLDKIERTLKTGVSGDDVKEAEKALQALGYSLKGKDGKDYGADGYFGTVTEEAVRAFQAANKLKVTGQIDAETLNALKKAASDTNGEVAKLDDSIWELVDGVNQLGGRQLIIESFKNIFQGLGNIVKPIKDAFSDIFPPMTAERLYELISGFNKLTEKFKEWTTSAEGSATIEKLTNTFKGFFSIIDIGLQFVKDLATGIKDLVVRIIPGLGGGILGVTGSIGKWLTGIRDSVKETNVFSTIISGITGFLGGLIDKLKIGASFLGKNIVTPGWEGFLNILKGIWDIVSKIGSKIAEFGKNIGSVFTNAFRSGNAGGIFDIVNGTLLASVLLSVKKFFKGLGESAKEGWGFLDKIKDTLDSVKSSLEAWQQNLQAGTLLKIAAAIGILAVSLLLIASIDSEKLASALGAITVLFAELMGSLKIFSMIDKGNMRGTAKAVTAMIGISLAVLILASALKKISSLSWEELAKGLLGVAGLITIVVIATKALSGTGAAKGAMQMVIFAAAITILASACKDLSSLSWEELAKGLLGVAGLMAVVSIFINNTKFGGKGATTAIGIIGISAAIKILASACKDFSQMSWEEIGKGLAAIAGLLLEIALFTKLTGNAKNVISTGMALIVIGAAMKIFASAMKDFSGLSWDEIGRGLAGMAGALLSVVLAMRVMPKNTVGIGIGLAVVSGALLILAHALNKMGGMSWEEIGKGLAAIGGSILILAIGLNAMKGTLAGSAALLLAAASLAILTPVLKTLGEMSIKSIITGLAAMAGVFAVLGIAGALLAPVIPAILGLAGAMALIGLGALAFGAGLLVAGAGLSALAVGGAAAASAIFTFIQQIGYGFVECIKIIGASAVEIGKAVKDIVLMLIDVFVECVPALADGALQLITALLSSLATYTPQIVDSLMDFLIGALNALASRTPELVSAVMNVVTSLFTAVADAIVGLDGSTLVKTAIGVALVGALIAMFSVLAPMIPGAIIGVLGMGIIIAELALVLAAIGALAQIPGLTWLVGEGGELMKKIGGAIGGFVGSIIGGIAQGITASLPQIGTDLSTFMTNLDPFLEGAKGITAEMLEGVGTLVSIILSITGASLLEGITSFITGSSSIESFGTQLTSLATALTDFVTNTASLSDGDITKVNTIAGIIDALVTAAGKVPASGGLAQAITGYPDLVTFSGGLVELGGAIASFSTSVSDISDAAIAKITNVGKAATELITVASKVPAAGGLAQAITGYPDLVTFSGGITSLGTAIVSFSTSVSDISDADIAKITSIGTAVTELTTLASKVPASGGLAQAITGAPDLGKFAGEMAIFGGKVAEFTGSVSEVTDADITKMTSIGTAAEKLVGVATSLSKYNGSTIFNTNLTEFAGEMKNFGTKMKEYSDSIKEVKLTKSASIVTQANKILALATSLADVDTGKLGTFGNDIAWLGRKVKEFYDKVADIDATTFSGIVTGLNTLSTMTGDSSGLQGFIDTLGTVSVTGVNKFVESFKKASPKVVDAVTAMLNSAEKAIRNKGLNIIKAVEKLVESAANAADSSTAISGFKSAGKSMAEGFAEGISSKTFMVRAAAIAMAEAALAAARSALKINSPSKVFMGVGGSVPEGFAKGIDNLGYMVTDSAESMANDAFSSTKKTLSRLAGIVNDGIDTQPTIRPILDLSEVTAGANAIDGMFGLQPSVGVLSNVGAISSMMSYGQNGGNSDVISAIKNLGDKLGNISGDTYNVNGVTYDDGSNVANAMKALVRGVKMERRT